MKKLALFTLTISLISCSIFKKAPKIDQEGELPIIAILDSRFTFEKGEEVYRRVEKKPEYPGGIENVHEHLSTKVKCLDSKRGFFYSGKIYIQFIVEKDGSLSNIVAFGPMKQSCEKEAVNALESMTKWIPGKHQDKTVRVSYALLFFVD